MKKTTKDQKSLLRQAFLKKIKSDDAEFYPVQDVAKELGYIAGHFYNLKANGRLSFKNVLLDCVSSNKKRWQICIQKTILFDYLKRIEFEEKRCAIEPYKPLSDEDVDQILLDAGEDESHLLPAPKKISNLSSVTTVALKPANAINALAEHYGLKPEVIQNVISEKKEEVLKKRRKDAEDIAYIRRREQQALDREKEKWRQMIASYVGYKLNADRFNELCKRLSWDSPVGDLYRAMGKRFSRAYFSNAIKGREVSEDFVRVFQESLHLSHDEIRLLFYSFPKITAEDMKKYGPNHPKWCYAKNAYENGLTPGRGLTRRS